MLIMTRTRQIRRQAATPTPILSRRLSRRSTRRRISTSTPSSASSSSRCSSCSNCNKQACSPRTPGGALRQADTDGTDWAVEEAADFKRPGTRDNLRLWGSTLSGRRNRRRRSGRRSVRASWSSSELISCGIAQSITTSLRILRRMRKVLSMINTCSMSGELLIGRGSTRYAWRTCPGSHTWLTEVEHCR
jgi:hypothetical protein